MFEKLKTLLAGNEAALSEIAKIEGNYTSLAGEVTTLESKLADSISKRDKYKGFSKTVKDNLSFEEGEELSEDTLKDKLSALKKQVSKSGSEKEEILKLEIANLQKAIEDQKTSYEGQIAGVNQSVLDKQLDLELFKSTQGINAVNAVASKMIMDNLRSGATIEDGNLVFKNEDGTIQRENGVPVTLASKLEGLKASEDFKFLFKADVQSGSGIQSESTNGNSNSNLTDFEKQVMENERKRGVHIQL